MSYTEKNFLDLNGLSRYDELIKDYIPITHGYYSNGNFYSDSSLTTLITGETKRLYIDLGAGAFYEYANGVYTRWGAYTNGNNVTISATQPTDQITGDIWLKIE